MKKRIIVIVVSLFVIIGALSTTILICNGNVDKGETDQLSEPQIVLPGTSETKDGESQTAPTDCGQGQDFAMPLYTGTEVITINGNNPYITADELHADEFIHFSELDSLGRCGPAEGCIGNGLLAKEPRGSIGMIKPAGWHTVKYAFIDGKYLYNRCHLIAYELCGVNADERNLITGTRYLNIDGMLAIENQVFSYISSTGNHVFYRVTPRYEANNLLATGVQIEAYSIEDHGIGITLNVFCFNVQPGVVIDYLTGDSYEEESDVTRNGPTTESEPSVFVPSEGTTFILNINTLRFHLIDCPSVQEMKDSNRVEFFGSRDELIEEGYIPCGRCHP